MYPNIIIMRAEHNSETNSLLLVCYFFSYGLYDLWLIFVMSLFCVCSLNSLYLWTSSLSTRFKFFFFVCCLPCLFSVPNVLSSLPPLWFTDSALKCFTCVSLSCLPLVFFSSSRVYSVTHCAFVAARFFLYVVLDLVSFNWILPFAPFCVWTDRCLAYLDMWGLTLIKQTILPLCIWV